MRGYNNKRGSSKKGYVNACR